MYIVCTVGAAKLEFLPEQEARERLRTIIGTLESVETWRGLFLRWYDIRNGHPWMKHMPEVSISPRSITDI